MRNRMLGFITDLFCLKLCFSNENTTIYSVKAIDMIETYYYVVKFSPFKLNDQF